MARELEFTLHNGFGLKESSLSSNMKPYAIIFIEGYPGSFKSTTDKIHGSYPVWNYAFKFRFQPPFPVDADVVFEIWHSSSTKIPRRMGRVKIPLQHFISGEANGERVSHAVHLSNGVVMGRISISHKCYIVSPSTSTPPANVPAIDVSTDNPLRPSRFSFGNIQGFANCFLVVQGFTELISDINS